MLLSSSEFEAATRRDGSPGSAATRTSACGPGARETFTFAGGLLADSEPVAASDAAATAAAASSSAPEVRLLRPSATREVREPPLARSIGAGENRRVDELDAVDTAYATYFPTVVERTGGTVVRSDGLVLWAGLHDSPFVVNGAVRLGDDRTPPDDLLRTVAEFFDERGHGHTLTVRSHRDQDLEAAAVAAGYRSFFELELMVCDEPPPEPQGIRVARAADRSEEHTSELQSHA